MEARKHAWSTCQTSRAVTRGRSALFLEAVVQVLAQLQQLGLQVAKLFHGQPARRKNTARDGQGLLLQFAALRSQVKQHHPLVFLAARTADEALTFEAFEQWRQ